MQDESFAIRSACGMFWLQERSVHQEEEAGHVKEIAAEWIRRLEARRPFLPLRPASTVDLSMDREIGALHPETLAGSEEAGLSLQVGLFLWNGSLDRSHTIAQEIETPTGSYWHGLMHRMEGDYSNAKYWFRLVGDHPAMTSLPAKLRSLLEEHNAQGMLQASAAGQRLLLAAEQAHWDPYGFIDAVAATERRQGSGELRSLLEAMQHAELAALAAYSAAQA